MTRPPHIRIGTRGSPLALVQARETQSLLMAAHGFSVAETEIIVITTTGDRVRDRPLSEIGGKGLFTKELEEALFAGAIDLAVHSMKDMPAQMPGGLQIGAVLEREDPRDALISFKATTVSGLPEGAMLGSSSVRRTAQALRLRPDLKTIGFRGNVETRLKKLEAGFADATFLACAGLKRLKLEHHITAAIPVEQMLPAVAQGAIGLQYCESNAVMHSVLARLDHAESALAVSCERAFMAALDGSCRTPIAGHATISGKSISFRGEALTLDGKLVFRTTRQGNILDAEKLGRDAGEEVKRTGGSAIAFA